MAKAACGSSLDDELEEAVKFCMRDMDIQLKDYRDVRYKVNSIHDSWEWPSMLLISDLLFSLPFTNSKVERMLPLLS